MTETGGELIPFEKRDTRKTVNERLREQLDQQYEAMGHFGKAMKEHADGIQAALANEQLTRGRVEKLEAVLGRGFVGRMKWAFFGR